MVERDAHSTMEEVLEAVFSVQSVPRLHNEEHLREKLMRAVVNCRAWISESAIVKCSYDL
jgi:hypothetical protein